jgi:hypothetical protein
VSDEPSSIARCVRHEAWWSRNKASRHPPGHRQKRHPTHDRSQAREYGSQLLEPQKLKGHRHLAGTTARARAKVSTAAIARARPGRNEATSGSDSSSGPKTVHTNGALILPPSYLAELHTPLKAKL